MRALPLPPDWETLLKRYLKKTFYAGTRKEGFASKEEWTTGDDRFFAKGVAQLNEYFTRERASLPKNYFNQKELRSGYLFYFLPINALKIATLLQIPPGPPLLKGGGGDLTIFDIGSGPGTGLFGVTAFLEQFFPLPSAGEGGPLEAGRVRVRWILIDQNEHALQDAKNLHAGLIGSLRQRGIPIESTVETIRWDIGRSRLPKLPEADLILASNLLGEFPSEHQLSFLQSTLISLKPTGRMLLMEPALQKTTRELMELHDQLLSRKLATVFAPCLHQAACPMLRANNRDWCHTYLEWERPGWIATIDRLVGIRKDYLKCSYLVLGPPLFDKERGSEGGEVWRVVSGHLNSNGKSELLLCGPGNLPDLLRIRRLDRDRSKENEWYENTSRGDLLRLPKTTQILRGTRI